MRAFLFVLLLPLLADAQTVSITRKGHLLLQKDGVTVSQHTVEREAVERAINLGPGTYRIVQPDLEVVVRQMPVVIGPVSWTKGDFRARVWQNTLAWVASRPDGRELMGWHEAMWKPTL